MSKIKYISTVTSFLVFLLNLKIRITMSKYRIIILFTLILPFIAIVLGCNDQNRQQNKQISTSLKNFPSKNEIKKIKKVTYYLENSASMFGYLTGQSEYIKVITELDGKPDFVEEDVTL